jgi:hypothetical protein
VLRECYSNDTLGRIAVETGLSSLNEADWDGYYASVAEPAGRPNRPFGEYATAVRKRPQACQREHEVPAQ